MDVEIFNKKMNCPKTFDFYLKLYVCRRDFVAKEKFSFHITRRWTKLYEHPHPLRGHKGKLNLLWFEING